ncbi:MAG: hypothetical protein HQL95_03940 [Magnetococcales bacterium]|nr:hypothetical protein [Magnetococcales bacterium]
MDNPDDRGQERGAAIMVILMIILMAGASMAIEALLIKSKRQREDQKAGYALMEAKRALIAFARIVNGDILPCPDLTPAIDYVNSATRDTSGACVDGSLSVGFLPWQTLELPPIFDGSNAPIWYAVVPSATYAACSLTINGQGSFAAILIAPGGQLAGQDRTLTTNIATVRAQFLEGGNQTTTGNFIAVGAVSETVNDRLLGITCAEMQNASN